MDIKGINKEPNPLSEKMIENGDKPFKLWLEFEETSPWDDPENDFANIRIDMLDGCAYAINVWTYKFLYTAQEDEKQKGNHDYVAAPDLFVRELTRECIEATIKTLLNDGDLDFILNPSVFILSFIAPYWDAMEMEESGRQAIMKELTLEIHEGHVLYGKRLELIARNTTNDDLILELDDGSIAVTRLTWKGKQEVNEFPLTRIYPNSKNFWNQEMKQVILKYGE